MRFPGATYLAFSGDADFDRRVERFSTHVAAILLEDGFTVNHRKTRIMRQGVRQHLAGLVINQRMNVKPKDFDLLKATLTNCVRFGADSQNLSGHSNFRAHLEGRVGFVESINPGKGKRRGPYLKKSIGDARVIALLGALQQLTPRFKLESARSGKSPKAALSFEISARHRYSFRSAVKDQTFSGSTPRVFFRGQIEHRSCAKERQLLRRRSMLGRSRC